MADSNGEDVEDRSDAGEPAAPKRRTKAGEETAGPAAKRSSTAKPLPPAAKRRIAGSGQPGSEGASLSSRYTAPVPVAKKGPSPRWVPVLMFALWILGLLLIILNYMGVLPGSEDTASGWYLVAGLGCILAGIIAATQYR